MTRRECDCTEFTAAKQTLPTPPRVGDTIYVPSQMYVYRGADDFAGGRAVVTSVEPNDYNRHTYECDYTVHVKERPKHGYFWSAIGPRQKEFEEEYGDQVSQPDPDNDPDVNDGEADWRPLGVL